MIAVLNWNAKQAPEKLSYEALLKKGEEAMHEGRLVEAGNWAEKALTAKPHGMEAQKLMAQVYDQQITEDKILSQSKAPEELKASEKSLQVKTLLERSRSLLEMNLLKEANDTAEEAIQLDPDNLEASRLLDEIKEKAQKLGREESLFLKNLYDEEVTSRIEKYVRQAEQSVKEKRWGAARLAVEKILLLDSRNSVAKKLLAEIDKNDDGASISSFQDFLDKE